MASSTMFKISASAKQKGRLSGFGASSWRKWAFIILHMGREGLEQNGINEINDTLSRQLEHPQNMNQCIIVENFNKNIGIVKKYIN